VLTTDALLAAIGEIRDAWAALVGDEALATLETELRRLRAALWPAA
jgi:hypothetical protein